MKMSKIEVSVAALDTLQRMVEELQAERDGLYLSVMSLAMAETPQAKKDAMDDCILLALSIEKP